MGKIYQISINIAYEPYIDPIDAQQYWRNIYTAVLTQDSTEVTDRYSASEFNWYIEQPNGNSLAPGSPAKSIELSTKDYLYGQSVMLEWVHDYIDEETQQPKQIILRSRVTLFDNGSITNVAKYTTEINGGGVFVHRADGNYDVGADWQNQWAYGVKIADTVDIIRAGQIFGSFAGDYLTIGRTSGNSYNIYMSANQDYGSLKFRYNSDTLVEIKNNAILLGNVNSGQSNIYIDNEHLYLRNGEKIFADFTNQYIDINGGNSRIKMRISEHGISFLDTVWSPQESFLTINSENIELFSLGDNLPTTKIGKSYIRVGNKEYNETMVSHYGLTFYKLMNRLGTVEAFNVSGEQIASNIFLDLYPSNIQATKACVGISYGYNPKWVYVSPKYNRGDLTPDTLNASCNIDLHNQSILNVAEIQSGGSRFIFFNNASACLNTRLLVGTVDYGGIFNVTGVSHLRGETYIDRLYLYDTVQASSSVANARLTPGTPARLAFVSSSSKRYKHDIVPIQSAEINPHLLYNVEVVQFKYNDDYLEKNDQRYKTDVPGFIAEDIADKYPIAADINTDGTIEDWNSRFIIPPMLKLIQEQKQMIDNLEYRLSQLERKG